MKNDIEHRSRSATAGSHASSALKFASNENVPAKRAGFPLYSIVMKIFQETV